MPEGNEIHRWAERHEAAFAGRVVRVDGPQGRFTDVAAIDGRKLRRVLAVGKHLGYDFGPDRILHVHLGMYGDFAEGSGALPEVKGALRLRMWKAAEVKRGGSEKGNTRHGWYSSDDGSGHIEPAKIAWLELRGPTDCSLFTEVEWQELLKRLGPDPLNGDGPDEAVAKIRSSKAPIAALLMNQSVMAGIGNIYRAELLYRARIDPFVAGRQVSENALRLMWKDAKTLMKAGMKDRRIVTTATVDRPSGAAKAHKEETHYVYRRHGRPCFRCGTKVERQVMAGRNLFWCPGCQMGDGKDARKESTTSEAQGASKLGRTGLQRLGRTGL